MSEKHKHVDELTLLRLAEGELASELHEGVRAHLLQCASCQSGYEALKAESELLRAAVIEQEEALPEHIRPRSADVSWLVVAAISLGTLAVSSLWSSYIAPLLSGMETVGLDGTNVLTAVLVQGLFWEGWSNMFVTLIDGAILLLIAAGLISALQWAWRRGGAPIATLGVVALVAFSPVGIAPAGAAEVVFDEGTYTLAEGDVVDNDLIVAARRVVIHGTINGDLIVAARQVEVTGAVEGDVLGVAETIDVTGRVGGSVRTGSRTLDIEGIVARNITSGGQTIRLRPDAALSGSVTIAGERTIIDAPVPRDVTVAAAEIEIDAVVSGSALMAGERLYVGPRGGIRGEARFYGAEEPDVDEDAELASAIDFTLAEPDPPPTIGERVRRAAFMWAAAFLFGATVLLLTPEATERILTTHVPEYGRSLVTGIVAVVVMFAFAILAIVTAVGFPLGLTSIAFLMIGLYVAQTYAAAYIGREILGAPTSASQGLMQLALGLLLIHVAKSIPIVAPIVVLLVALWGFGALVSYLRSNLGDASGSPQPSASDAPPPAPPAPPADGVAAS